MHLLPDQLTVSDRFTWQGERKRPRAVVMLGGGGARGIAHLGALEAIQHDGYSLERLIGISMGSLVGGLYATNPDIEAVQAKAIDFLESSEFAVHYQAMLDSAPKLKSPDRNDRVAQSDWYGWIQKLILTSQQMRKLFRGTSLVQGEFLEYAVESLIPDIDIEQTQIPLTILAADLHAGMPVALESGSLRRAIVASASIPGFFPPVAWDDLLLCDLGVVNSLPLEIARSYDASQIIGVDVAGALTRVSHYSHAVDVMVRMDEIGERISRRQSLAHGDLIIRPGVSHRPWYDFREPRTLINAGRTAGRQALRAAR